MALVMSEMSMSLDGFIAGPNDGVDEPLGIGGDRLHQWVYDLESWRELHGLSGGQTGRDSEIVAESFENSGAIVMGRRMFDHGEGPWGDEPPFGVPVFVLTHRDRPRLVKGETTFTFVTDGIEHAVQQARQAAGDLDISIAGGASMVRQAIGTGLLHQIQIHLVPVLLGGGVRLFDLQDGMGSLELAKDRVIDSDGVTHLRYRLTG